MKAIVSSYIPAGNIRGARYKATDGDGCTVYVQAADILTSDENHSAAVRKLCAKRGWTGKLVCGYLLRQGRVDHVWVWLEEGRQKTDIITVP